MVIELENLKKNFYLYDLILITLAVIIGRIIHELDISSIAKMGLVIVICTFIALTDKARYKQRWRIAQVGKINKYVFIGYIFIVAFVILFVIKF